MRGFSLDLELYCASCPEFEVAVDEEIFCVNDFELMTDVRYFNRRITCEHIERCRSLYKKARKDIKDEEYRQTKEIENERRKETSDSL